MLTRKESFESIKKRLEYLQLSISNSGKLNQNDLAIHAENFFRDLLNHVYGLNLSNANTGNQNAADIDLIDFNAKLAFQVTARNDRKKIEDTLDSFHSKEKNSGWRLKFMLISKEAVNYRNFKDHVTRFDPVEDIIDINRLLRKINDLENGEISKVVEFLKKEIAIGQTEGGISISDIEGFIDGDDNTSLQGIQNSSITIKKETNYYYSERPTAEPQKDNLLSFETIKPPPEKRQAFFERLSNVLRENRWPRRLILFVVVIAAIGSPFSPSVVGSYSTLEDANEYKGIFIGVEVLLLIVSSWLIYRKLRKDKESEKDITRIRSRAIKGLLSFTSQDVAVFSNLQRNAQINDLTEAIGNDGFRFGIISGRSGCGKTSILQAGVCPCLIENGHQIVYVKLTNESPLKTIRESLEILNPSISKISAEADLSTLLKSTLKDKDHLLLVLDQFEQFFTHNKNREASDGFVSQIAYWYQKEKKQPIKILFSLRNDFRHDVDAWFQSRMDYALTKYQNFILEKFRPEQAAKVFAAMAKDVGIECDREFIEKISREQLAGKDDGLVSPVDIQVLADMMIRVHDDQSSIAFDEKAFQKVGGVDGLMEQFLIANLDSLSTDKNNELRQAAVNVLLALVDFEKNARVGMLIADQINEKLAALSQESKIERAIQWLIELRLITPDEREGQKGVELSHERLIPALRKLANEIETPAQQTKLMLDRRANEWIGNDRNRRYLFNLDELQRIGKYKNVIDWGENREIKDELIRNSWRRLRNRIFLFGLPIMLALISFGGFYFWWEHTDSGRFFRIERSIGDYVKQSREREVLVESAIARIYRGEPEDAEAIITNLPDATTKFADYLRVARLMRKFGRQDKSIVLLDLAEKQLDQTNDNYIGRLISLCDEFNKSGDSEKARVLYSRLNVADRDEPSIINAELKSSIPSADNLFEVAVDFKGTGNDKIANNLLRLALLKLLDPDRYVQFDEEFSDDELNTISNDISLIVDPLKRRIGTAFKENDFFEIADLINDDTIKYDVLNFFIRCKELAGDITGADSIAKKYNPILTGTRDNEKRIMMMLTLARLEGKKGSVYTSLGFLDQSSKEIKSMPEASDEQKERKQSLISESMVTALELSEKTKSEGFIDFARGFLNDGKITNVDERNRVRLSIAESMLKGSIEKNNIGEAAQLRDAAIKIASECEFPESETAPLPRITLGNQTRNKLISFSAILGKLNEDVAAKNFFKIAISDFRTVFRSVMNFGRHSGATKAIYDASLENQSAFLVDFIEQRIKDDRDNIRDGNRRYAQYLIAPIFARLGNLSKAHDIAASITDENLRARTYAQILIEWEILKHPEYANIEKELNEEF